MIEVEVLGVSEGPSHPMVLLRNDDRVLPIVVGISEANAIQMGLAKEKLGRPMTHDLLCNVLAGLGGELKSVTIYKLENETFFAHLNVEQKGASGDIEQVLKVDSRPSDGVAIAVRIGCPIFVADSVMDAAGQDVAMINPEEESDDSEDFDTR